MNVIQFPARTGARPITDLLNQAPADAVDQRAAELLRDARLTIKQMPPEAIASMLAYAAARLERTGFRMFRDGQRGLHL